MPARQVSHDNVAGRQGNFYPSVAPHGKRIVYSSAARAPKKSYDTFVIVLDDLHLPFEVIHDASRAAWSPDGTRIAFDRWTRAAHSQVCVMDLGGKRPAAT